MPGSFFDSDIVLYLASAEPAKAERAESAASALLADCDTLYSDDMHDSLVLEGRLRIVDPFRHAPS